MSSDELFIPIDFEHSCLFFVTKGTRTFLYSERPIEFPKNISHSVPAVDGVDVSEKVSEKMSEKMSETSSSSSA